MYHLLQSFIPFNTVDLVQVTQSVLCAVHAVVIVCGQMPILRRRMDHVSNVTTASMLIYKHYRNKDSMNDQLGLNVNAYGLS